MQTTNKAETSTERALFVLAIGMGAGIVFVLFWPALAGKVYVKDDLASLHLPTRAMYADNLARNESLLWNSRLLSGYYLHGEGEVGMFHPLHLMLYRALPLVLAFNTQLVPPQDVPRSYQDLLLPKWRGKMNFGSDEYAWYSVMLDGMGKAKGLEFMRALARQQLHIPGGSSIMRLQLMLAGESAIAIAARGRRATEYREKGAPLDYRLLDPYPAEPNGLALMRRAAHPHASILFIDWMLSDEGQTVLAQQVPRLTLRKGVKQIPRHQELYKKDFVFVNPASIGPNLNELITSYQQIFNVR